MQARLFIAAALAVCACSPIRTDLEKYGLNCKAREVTLQTDTLELPYTAIFNKDGQLLTVSTRNFDVSERYTETYMYNSRKQLEEIIGINAEGETEARYEYEIDGPFVKECRIYGMNNQEMHRWIHENDGRHIVRTEYLSEGEPEYITTKEFKSNGYVEESRTPDGTLMGRATIEYLGTETKPTRIIGTDLDVIIDYNSKGLPIMSRGVVLNSLNEMQWTFDLEEHPCHYYSYEYDERGNWISRAESYHPDSTAFVVLRRTIVY